MDSSRRRLPIPAASEEGAGRRPAKRGEAGVLLAGGWSAGAGRYDEVYVRAAAGVIRGGGSAGVAAAGGSCGVIVGPTTKWNCASSHAIRWL